MRKANSQRCIPCLLNNCSAPAAVPPWHSKIGMSCSVATAAPRVKTGASDNPVAVLDGIKDDTSLMARQSAHEHLEKEVEDLLSERERLGQKWLTLKEAGQRQGCGLPGCGLALLAFGAIAALAGINGASAGRIALGFVIGVADAGIAVRGWRGPRDPGTQGRAIHD